jgi:subtilisin-like proprotein convertase family protein
MIGVSRFSPMSVSDVGSAANRKCSQATVRRRPAVALAALAVFLLAAAQASADTFTNSSGITINDATFVNNGPDIAAAATPYPSTIAVSGLTGTITDVDVTLTNLTHSEIGDVDVLLVGPGGQKLLLMSDVGRVCEASNDTLTFDDGASQSVPDCNDLASGTYKPSNYAGNTGEDAGDSFPSPAPAPPYDSALSTFNGAAPNGTWSLYVVDDQATDTGSIGGWSLTITTEALAVTFLGSSATSTRAGVVVRWRTGSEVETLGFNVYRQVRGTRVKLNRRLIPARNSVSGARYSYRDRRAPRARSLRYWLQIVDLDGSRAWRGPIRVTRSD